MREALAVLIIACGCAQPSEPVETGDAAPAPVPTYHQDIAPLLAEHCRFCHTSGGMAPFALDSYQAARDHAALIAKVTEERRMPPWPADASGACGEHVGHRWLDQSAIGTFAAWFEGGTPAGEPAPTPAIAEPAIASMRSDIQLRADTSFVVPAAGDTYRCFIVDPELASDRYLTAYAADLDRTDIVHHMQLFAFDDDIGEADARERDLADAGPGYSCDVGAGTNLRYIGVWAPGDHVRRWADDTGLLVKGDRPLLLQIHYHNHTSEPVTDHSGMALELADQVDHIAQVRSFDIHDLVLPADQTDLEQSITYLLNYDEPRQIHGARLHMHSYGASGSLEIVRQDGSTDCVLDVPRWDVGWQLFYMFEQPLPFEKGDKLRVTCTYDTRGAPGPVVSGPSADNEMCIGYLLHSPVE